MKRVVYGRRNNGDFGLFISKPGQNAHTITDDKALAFSSEIPHGLAMHAKGLMGPFGVNGGTLTANFPALSYVPQVMLAFYDGANGYYYFTQKEVRVAGDPTTGTYNVRSTTGPSATITTNSVSITAPSTHGGLYGHYIILRMPGGG